MQTLELPDKGCTGAVGWVVSGPRRGKPAGPPGESCPALPEAACALRALRLRVRRGAQEPEVACSAGGEAVFHGELHNRAELARQLGAAPGASAAELALEVHRRWGENGFPRLRGVFALVVWDATRRTLLCVRDPLGTYPLFYAEAGDELLVSASSEALLHHPAVSRQPSAVWLADRLRHRFPDAGLTQYRDVRRVMPGHLLKCVDGTCETHRYWHPIHPERPVDWAREDVLEQFQALLERKIGDYTGGVQPAVFLSGGLDSISVAALATEQSRRDGTPVPWGLSLQFSGSAEADESATQRHAAQVLGMPLHLATFDETVSRGGLFALALEQSASLSQPLVNPWLPAYVELGRRGVANGCRVILTGGGGDEWLCVNPFLAADLIRRVDVPGFIDLYRSQRRDYRLSHREALEYYVWWYGLRPLLRDAWDASAGRRALRMSARSFIQSRKSGHSGEDPYPWFLAEPNLRREVEERPHPEKVVTRDHYFRSIWEIIDHPVISCEAEELFEYGQPHGFSVRRPYWDAEVVEFLCRVPPRMLNSGQRSKGLVRRLLSQKFPALGVERQVKVSAADFFQTRALGEAPDAWNRLGGVRALAELGVVDGPATETYFRKALADRKLGEADRIWTLLCLESWLQART